MMRAIQSDEAPSYYFMHYEIVAAQPEVCAVSPSSFPSPPVGAKVPEEEWVGCHFALERIPADAGARN
jgi:hypothetical protein